MTTRPDGTTVAEDALRTHAAYERLGWARRALLRVLAPSFVSEAARTGRDAHHAFTQPTGGGFRADRASSWFGQRR